MPIPNSVAENVLGTMGTVCWSGQLLPQIWKSWREKSTKGFSHWLMLLWGFSSVFLGAYALLQELNIPLIVQPQLFGALCLVSWGQCQYYELKRTRLVATLMTLGVIVVCGAIEVLLVLTIRPIQNPHNKHVATMFFGVLSAVLISTALFPQYYEIYKYKAVIGISLVFMGIDMLGGLLNDLSLVFSESFDPLAACSYTLVIVLDGVIVICAAVFKIRDWRRKRHGLPAVNADQDLEGTIDQPPAPMAVEGESSASPIQHLTILSRTASRLSETSGRYTWAITENTTPLQNVAVESKEEAYGKLDLEEGRVDDEKESYAGSEKGDSVPPVSR
ncbi:hypothetical protein D9611_006327 [Ephemerocybe angulata]|uniref:Uncharacterized protein n=1 Tax=Ephemerocybe angulata TaxID=980116 RepID=A0A8H5C6T5_9AGAR|nr:hypothetical protein D9611_006327 [Tulosesus angulatus]